MTYKIGSIVWVAPSDYKQCKGVVVGFQKVIPFDPIVEIELDNKKKIKNAFSKGFINPYRKGKVHKL